MPEEILIIIIVSIVAASVISIVRMGLNFAEKKSTSEGSTLTTSELERMMRRAVEDATAPLARKVEDLEFDVASRNKPEQLREAREDLLLDLDDEEAQVDAERVPVKNREGT